MLGDIPNAKFGDIIPPTMGVERRRDFVIHCLVSATRVNDSSISDVSMRVSIGSTMRLVAFIL